MKMSIDEARYLIEHHKPNDINNAYELGEAFCVAIEIMEKFQKIKDIYDYWNVDFGIEAHRAMMRIGEVIEDGKKD